MAVSELVRDGVTVSIVLSVCLGALLVYYLRRRPPGSPPLHAGWIPWLGCAVEFGKTPLLFIDQAKQKYGPVFSLLIAGRRMTFLTEIEDFKHFFKSGSADFQMAVEQPVRNTASISAESFYKSHTKIHDTIKGCLAPSLLPPLGKTLNKHFAENILEWGKEGQGDLNELVRTSMYRAVLDNLFGHNVLKTHTETYKTLEKHFVTFDDQFEYGSQLPGVFLKDWSKSKRWLLDFFENVVAKEEKHTPDQDNKTVLQTLVQIVDRPHAPNYALLMMWAALANAIPITFWTLALIMDHPDVFSILRAEVDLVLGRPSSGKMPSISESDLEKLPTVKAAILEAIRLRSPGAIARGVKTPFTVRGYTIPAGDLLLMSPYWAHRNTKYFPDPEAFKPSRWTESENVDLEKNIFMEGFVAFGGGRYQCPGRWFALLEIHIYVSLVLHMFDIQLLDKVPSNSPLHLVGTQQPEGPCRIKFNRRFN